MRNVGHYDEFAKRVFQPNEDIGHVDAMVVTSRIKVGVELPCGK